MIVPGSACLVFHPQHAWVPGVVENYDGKVGVVSASYPKKEQLQKVKGENIFVCDENAMEEDVNDLLNLSILHDGTLLTCLRMRYFKDIVYTNIGAIVVALNPFNFKIPWYMDDKMQTYLTEGETIQQNLPHSWAVANNTYYEMRAMWENQSILVSGESGAGKTEASKIVMKYLAAVSALRGTSEEISAGQQVGLKMIQTNPILEAFGNAKTVRNDNSSRFGKLMKIKFNSKGILTGADITKYLLEKSRIIFAAQEERVYHSFYLLLQGSDREKFGLEKISNYKTVNSGNCIQVPSIDDAEEYRIVMEAMTTCGVTDFEREAVWHTLGGILALENVEFKEKDQDSCEIDGARRNMVAKGCQFLEIPESELTRELLTTTLVIQKQKVVKTLTKVKSYDARDSLCKAIYDNVFAWLVTSINNNIDTEDCHAYIALLDIFGFEDFTVNGFEQCCINLTNETLQGHYNNYIFIRDMEECKAEGIDTHEIQFPDNTPCLDMISGRGGILAVLDEECLLGKATDLTFLDKITDRFNKNPFFEKPRLAKVPSFKIHHYAGTVTYEVENFLEKNRDTLKDAFKTLLRSSANPFTAALLPEPGEGQRFTVGGYFKNQLKSLMELINSTNPHWIRCVKPHMAKKPLMFDGVLTLAQLRSSGVLGTVQIRKAGYPIRLKLTDFMKRYRVVARGVDGVDFKNPTAVCQAVYKAAGFTTAQAQVGKTRAFLKSEAYQHLEYLKKIKLQVFAVTAVQAANIAISRFRTACFQRNHFVRIVQAALRGRVSQKLWRVKDFDTRKDEILAQIKILLKLQQEEEAIRKEIALGYDAVMSSMNDEKYAHLKKMEALWWEQKPNRDKKQQDQLIKEEEEARKKILHFMEDAAKELDVVMVDGVEEALMLQQEREEEERQAELQRMKEEEERLRREEEERLEQEKREREARRDEQRRLAIYFWEKHLKDEEAEKKKQTLQQQMKLQFLTEAARNNAEVMRLKVEESRTHGKPVRFERARFSIGIKAAPQHVDASSAEQVSSPARRQAASDRDASVSGIGGLNPMMVNPAKEKSRLTMARLYPSADSSLGAVHCLRRLGTIRDTCVLQTPSLPPDDLRNPMNPNSPDWNPTNPDVIELPDGTQLSVRECEAVITKLKKGGKWKMSRREGGHP